MSLCEKEFKITFNEVNYNGWVFTSWEAIVPTMKHWFTPWDDINEVLSNGFSTVKYCYFPNLFSTQNEWYYIRMWSLVFKASKYYNPNNLDCGISYSFLFKECLILWEICKLSLHLTLEFELHCERDHLKKMSTSMRTGKVREYLM